MAKSLLTAFVFVLCVVVIFTQEASETKWEHFEKKLKCGKDDPGDDTAKCHKYGTDSGFKCCYIKKEDADAICRLVSYGEVDEIGVSGKDAKEKEFENGEKLKLACGSSYIKLISTSVIIALVSLIMF
jgi:hypothetical protein